MGEGEGLRSAAHSHLISISEAMAKVRYRFETWKASGGLVGGVVKKAPQSKSESAAARHQYNSTRFLTRDSKPAAPAVARKSHVGRSAVKAGRRSYGGERQRRAQACQPGRGLA